MIFLTIVLLYGINLFFGFTKFINHGMETLNTETIVTLGKIGYNAQFEAYFGERRSREQAKGLTRKIIVNNESDDYSKITIILQKRKC